MPRTSDNTALLDAPQVAAPKPAPHAAEDTGMRTVLHGWGKLSAQDRHFVDDFLFEGGVCRNVPVEIATLWQTGKTPDGKKSIGHVVVHVLPNDATEADFIKATGVQPMPVRRLANMLGAYSIDELRAAMGDEKALEFTKKLMKSFNIDKE